MLSFSSPSHQLFILRCRASSDSLTSRNHERKEKKAMVFKFSSSWKSPRELQKEDTKSVVLKGNSLVNGAYSYRLEQCLHATKCTVCLSECKCYLQEDLPHPCKQNSADYMPQRGRENTPPIWGENWDENKICNSTLAGEFQVPK